MLTRIRIGSKLAFTITFTLFFFVAVTVAYTLILHQCLQQNQTLRDREMYIHNLANEVAVHMLQARRMEKDFLMRKEPSLIEAVEKSVGNAITQAEQMVKLSHEGGDPRVVDKARQIIQAMEAYRQAFQALSQGYQQLGLRDEEGLQGAMSRASQALDTLLRTPEWVSSVLTLWNSEKGYGLRHDPALAVEVETTWQQLHDTIHRRPAGKEGDGREEERLLDDYLHHWRALLAREQENRQLSDTMRHAVHAVEPLTEEIRQVTAQSAAQIAAETQAFGERASVLLLLFSLLTVAVCAVVCALIIRSIVQSLGSLKMFAQEISQGRWEATTQVDGCDELGGLAMAMRTMVNQVRTVRVLAERLTLMFVLIGRGTLPSPMEGTFQGEFKAVGAALNQAVNTLSALLALAEPLQRLARHEPAQTVDENRYPGDFKVLARAVNQLIHHQQSGS